MTTFFVPGTPRPQGSKRHVGRGIMVESSKHLPAWRQAVALVARQHFRTPLDGPVHAEMEFIMPRPKSWGKDRQDPMVQRPDTDKLERAVLDAITGVALVDDSQVTRVVKWKRRARHGEGSGVRVTLVVGDD